MLTLFFLFAFLALALLLGLDLAPDLKAAFAGPQMPVRGADSKPQLVCHKGGGVPAPPKQEKVKLPDPPKINMPKPLPPPPPPSQNMDSVSQAQEDARRKAARQNGLSKTLLAGETGGWRPGMPAGEGKRTLLG